MRRSRRSRSSSARHGRHIGLTATNYDLRGDGPDDVFFTSDDTMFTVAPTYTAGPHDEHRRGSF